tara:strand:- start:11 stop:1027 length:1017 start_codon:yes stop_codon:yes gene_type:complete
MLSHKWSKQVDTLLADVDRLEQEDDRLEEIRVIIGKRDPALQQLGWDAWLLSDPLNQRLADLDIERALEMFKRDNLLAKRSKATGGRRKKVRNYVLTFGGSEGTRSYLTTGFNPDDFDLNLGFTVSYWVRPDEVGDLMFAFGRRHNSNQRFAYGINTATAIYAGVGDTRIRTNWAAMGATTNPQLAGLFNASNELKTGNFIHFAATYANRGSTGDGSVAHKIYLNGVHIKTNNINWSATGGGTSGMFIGARNNVGDYNQGWKCALSHLAIFDTAQSDSWVEGIYNAGRTGTDFTGQSGLVGYWKFNKGNGTTVTDHSGNGNNGTFATDGTGLPVWENI